MFNKSLLKSPTFWFIVITIIITYSIWYLHSIDYYYYYEYYYSKNFAHEQFKWTALIFANFNHMDLSHLLNNLLGAAICGFFIEEYIRWEKYFFICLISGIFSFFIFSLYGGYNTMLCGASAMVFGLYGATTHIETKKQSYYIMFILSPFLYEILLIVQMLPNYDEILDSSKIVHFFGFIFGFLISYILDKSNRPSFFKIRN